VGSDAYARFNDDPHLLALAVLEHGDKPVGLLTRAGFALKMADRFGRALYEKRPVSFLISQPPPVVSVNEPLSALNALILSGGDGVLLDGFIGVDEGRYCGVGTGLDVLRATAQAAARTSKRLAAERARAKTIELSLIELFRSADALAQDKSDALAKTGVADVRSISQHAPAELADLIPRIEHLFAEIRSRDAAILDAFKAAEAANQAKGQFLANTSHELRTPLNAIIGYAELVEEEALEKDEAAMAHDARRVVDAARHLLRLINDILDMSKIEAGRVQVCADDFDLSALIRESVAVVAPQARANNNRLHTDIAAEVGAVRTDGLRVRQCLLNLLSNAVKFTRDGVVAVKARVERRSGEEVATIAVIDSGIGMNAEEISRLFQPFAQANARTTTLYGGTGLGLAITRHLARMLGGDIHVLSAPGQGSCFTLSFQTQLDEQAVAA
jgi:signal transduction histidine kinase